MRLNYSRRSFVMTFPAQKQEAFFEGHVRAFEHFGGVPHRLSYDNLTRAIKPLVEGRSREEQRAFIAFRSYYLFSSHFCTPGQGHEKGGVEHSVGFSRRNFLVPILVWPPFSARAVYARRCAGGAWATDEYRTSLEERATVFPALTQASLRLLCHAPGEAHSLQSGGV